MLYIHPILLHIDTHDTFLNWPASIICIHIWSSNTVHWPALSFALSCPLPLDMLTFYSSLNDTQNLVVITLPDVFCTAAHNAFLLLLDVWTFSPDISKTARPDHFHDYECPPACMLPEAIVDSPTRWYFYPTTRLLLYLTCQAHPPASPDHPTSIRHVHPISFPPLSTPAVIHTRYLWPVINPYPLSHPPRRNNFPHLSNRSPHRFSAYELTSAPLSLTGFFIVRSHVSDGSPNLWPWTSMKSCCLGENMKTSGLGRKTIFAYWWILLRNLSNYLIQFTQ